MKNKKLIGLLLAVLCMTLMVFAGCGSGGGDDADADAKAEAVEYPITVEDNEYFTFEITGYDDTWSEYKYKITNNTDKDISFSSDSAVINGETTIDTLIYCDLAAGTSGSDSFFVDEEQLADYEAGDEITMAIKYEVYDEETFDTITEGEINFVFTKQ